MAEASIPVDLLNPGQVFACIGLTEAAEVLLGDAEGTFDWTDPTQTLFHVRANGDQSPVEAVLTFLSRAEAVGVAPEGHSSHDEWKEASWGPLEASAVRDGYSIPPPQSLAKVACHLNHGNHSLVIDYWGDERSKTSRDNVKFWGGSGGKPGVAFARDALKLVRKRISEALSDPFALGVPQSSSFRLDWRRDYIPLDTGFSLNKHDSMITVGFPVVELLAAVGLSHARPRRPVRGNKLEYTYSVLGTPSETRVFYPITFLRASLGGAPLPFPCRHFRMSLGNPSKDERSITAVIEETK